MRARRVDKNHGELIALFRKAGCSVLDTSRLGDGAPDCTIGYGGISLVVEIKDGTRVPSQRQLTDDERRFAEGWKGGYYIIKDADEAMSLVALLRRMAWRTRDITGLDWRETLPDKPVRKRAV